MHNLFEQKLYPCLKNNLSKIRPSIGSNKGVSRVSRVGRIVVSQGRVEDGRISFGLPLAKDVIPRDNMGVVASNLSSHKGAGSDSQGSLAGLIGLGVKSRGSEEGGYLMDSSLEFTIVSGNSLVASNSNRNSSIGGSHLGFYLGDGIGDSRGNSSIGIADSSIGVASKSSIGKNNRWLSLSLSLSNEVISGDNMGVVASNLGTEESTCSTSQGPLAGLIGLGVKGWGSEEGRNFMNSSLEFTIVTSNSLVASNSNRNGSVGGSDLGFYLGDGIGDSRGNSSIGIADSSIGVASKTSIGKNNSWLSLSLSLSLSNKVISGDNMGVVASNLGTEESAGSNSQGSLAGLIGLGVESGGSEEGRYFMNSSLEFTIVSSNGLVASNSHRDSSIGGDNLSFCLGDRVCDSWSNCSIGVADSSIRIASKSSIGKNNSWLSISLSLSNEVISGDNMGVVASNLGTE